MDCGLPVFNLPLYLDLNLDLSIRDKPKIGPFCTLKLTFRFISTFRFRCTFRCKGSLPDRSTFILVLS